MKDINMLGQAETKLLYTLHWILLFASDECADEETDATTEARNHLFSIPTISLFVYLFAPIVNQMKESVHHSNRLENGEKLWHGMCEHSPPPGAPCFTAAVKPKARQLLNNLLSARDSLDAYCPNRKFNYHPLFIGNCLSRRRSKIINHFNISDSPNSIAIQELPRHEEEVRLY